MLSGSTTQTLFNPNKTVVKMFVVMYDLRAMPAGHQTFLRQRTFSVPVRRDPNNQTSRKPLTLGQGRTLRYLIHLRWDGWFIDLIYLCPAAVTFRLFYSSSPTFCFPSQPGSRALSLGRSTSIGTSDCCFPGSPWRWIAVLPTSSSPSQSPPLTHHSLPDAEAWLPPSVLHWAGRNLSFSCTSMPAIDSSSAS